MKILLISDIHANLTALTAVLSSIEKHEINKVFLLGDHIDYGMRPNEVIETLKSINYDIEANIWGNHELVYAGMESEKLSCDRARQFSDFTAGILTDKSKEYLNTDMNSNGFQETVLDGKNILAVHGSLKDIFWDSINYNNATEIYLKYDYVISGHSHYPLYFEKYYDDPKSDKRGKKKTVFINPGSVGQTRNHNPGACYGVLDISTGSVCLNHINYDISYEQSLYTSDVHEFYKLRIEKGI